MEVKIDLLLELSETLVEKYLYNHDIYSVLALSLITVTKYSHNKQHLTSRDRLAIAEELTPEIITHLTKIKVFAPEEIQEIQRDYFQLRKNIPLILSNYLIIADSLKLKNEPKIKRSCCW